MKVLFDGYNQHSPTRFPIASGGDCLGKDWSNCLLEIDPAAPIYSGDFVRLHLKYTDGVVTQIIKQLRCSHGGSRWWGWCEHGVFPIGIYVVPDAIEKVVARENGHAFAVDTVKRASEAEAAWFAELAAPALAEWEQLGLQRSVPWPGLDAVIRAARGEA